MAQIVEAEEFIRLSKQYPLLDVRSPGEFSHAHIPDAINFPLFNDEERAIIGTLYKQQGRQHAMLEALRFYSPNMKRNLELLHEKKISVTVLVHCWRGGMRSNVFSWMLELFGFKTILLKRGYKAYRNFVLKTFGAERKLIVLGGRTGAAKTETLSAIKKHGEQTIDLESLANHRGSAFGDIGLPPPPTQEQFENNLAGELFFSDRNKPLWLEDESQRIGWVNIPNALWNQMRSAEVCYLEIDFENRLDHITEVYGNLNMEQLQSATVRITKKLGGQNAKEVLDLLNENKVREAFSILLKYYDKRYDEALEKRIPETITKIFCSKIAFDENAQLAIQSIQQKIKL